ncbi:hypothetical protein BDFG_02597 [Blastomyces dermatitidis ATCC 26199]|nr:hypothetical protein BDFG_02597 [Blastomyces dermatitidis ATCC 26199]
MRASAASARGCHSTGAREKSNLGIDNAYLFWGTVQMEMIYPTACKTIQQRSSVCQLTPPPPNDCCLAVDPCLKREHLFPTQNGGFEKQGRRVGKEKRDGYYSLSTLYGVRREELHAGDDGSNNVHCWSGRTVGKARQNHSSIMGMKSMLQTPVHWGLETSTKRIGQMQEITSYWADHITFPSEDAVQGRVISQSTGFSLKFGLSWPRTHPLELFD